MYQNGPIKFFPFHSCCQIYKLQNNQVVKQKLKCYHCRKLGHVISDCWELKGSPKSDGKNPAGFVSQWRKQEGHTNYRNHNVFADTFGYKNDKCNESSDSGVVNCSLPAEFTPFVLEGSVSKETDSESAKTVKILRDTRCMQSLILTSALPTAEFLAVIGCLCISFT